MAELVALADPRAGDLLARRGLGLGLGRVGVARDLGRGQSNAEIAAALHLSVPTVKAHVSRLLDKLDVDNRVQIALLVQDAGGQ